MDKLRELTPTKAKKGLIFDDMSFVHLPREAQIHLVDVFDDTQIHCRYNHVEIPAGTPRIITTNLLPSQIFKWDEEAIRRRCTSWNLIKTKAGKLKLVNLDAYHEGETTKPLSHQTFINEGASSSVNTIHLQ